MALAVPGTALPGVALVSADRNGARVLSLRGRLDVAGAGRLWAKALRAAAAQPARPLIIDLTGLDSCDTAGAAMLLAMGEARSGATVEGVHPQVATVMARARDALVVPPRPPPARPVPWRLVIGRGLAGAGDGFAYLGEALVAVLRLPVRSRQFRIGDFLRTADEAGVRAVPLVLLLGLLIGLILAFQSLAPMQRFGADLYVANLVAISLLRELGPLLASVVLAGRSGSAFAAEIGTMKVNQEIDALVTMGIDPMTMLVLPRMAAALLVMPALTVLLEMAGLAGMSVVLVGAGIPMVAIAKQVTTWVLPTDFYGGLAKAVVFGAAVAAIGCRAGLSAGHGPRAVGHAATAAVVGGIVATIVLDGAFAVLFYRIGL
jgi:phospholipid/cholesterol/gamma-HCH transport system permease protein